MLFNIALKSVYVLVGGRHAKVKDSNFHTDSFKYCKKIQGYFFTVPHPSPHTMGMVMMINNVG